MAADAPAPLAFLAEVDFGGHAELQDVATAQFQAMEAPPPAGEGTLSDQELLVWCKENPLVRVVDTDVTALFFPAAGADARAPSAPEGGAAPPPPPPVVVYIRDAKVFPRGGKYKGRAAMTDDTVYAEHADIRERVPRGLAFLQVAPASALVRRVAADGKELAEFTLPPSAGSATVLVRGLRKFTGRETGDDDDKLPAPGATPGGSGKDDEWARFFTADPSSAVAVAAMEKANGESAHFAVVACPAGLGDALAAAGQPVPPHLFVAGSKTVHMALRSAADGAHAVYAAPRFGFARPIAAACMAVVAAQAPPVAAAFVAFMAAQHLTLCLEFLNPATQHVERFDFTSPIPQALTFVSGRPSQPAALALGLHPVVAVRVAAHFGFPTIAHELHDMTGHAAVLAATRERYGKEGSVLYYCDAAGTVLGLVKRKSVWYIIQRALREKVRGLGAKLGAVADALAAVDPGLASGDGGAPTHSRGSLLAAMRGVAGEAASVEARVKRSRGKWRTHVYNPAVKAAAAGATATPAGTVALALLGSGASDALPDIPSAHPVWAGLQRSSEGAPRTAAVELEAWLSREGGAAPAGAPAGGGGGGGKKKRRRKKGKGKAAAAAEEAAFDASTAPVPQAEGWALALAAAQEAVRSETQQCACRMALRLVDIAAWLQLHPATLAAYADVCLGFIAAVGGTGVAGHPALWPAVVPTADLPTAVSAPAEGGGGGFVVPTATAETAGARADAWLAQGWSKDLLAHRYPQMMAVWLAATGVNDNIEPRTVDAAAPAGGAAGGAQV